MDNGITYALITGGSKGIGYALARECAGRGMNLLLIAKPGDGLESAASTLSEEFPVRVHTLEVDLTDLHGPRKVWEWCSERGFRVDILVNNAGVSGADVFESSSLTYSDERIMLNVRALVLLTQLFLPELKKHPRAHILNTGSISAYFALPYKAVYAASKAFVKSFSRALSVELKDTPVSVTIVHPNGVRKQGKASERIDTHSKLARMLFIVDADKVARVSINKMLKGKLVVIPGFMNRILLTVAAILPASYKEKRSAAMFIKEVLDM